MAMTSAGTADAAATERGPWADELVELVRGASGGLLFGVPLLYTMEVWWTGTHTEPLQAVGLLALLFVPVLVLNKTEGFRGSRDVRLARCGGRHGRGDRHRRGRRPAAVLVLLRELTPETPVEVWLGKVLYESVPFCLGVGVARHFLRRRPRRSG